MDRNHHNNGAIPSGSNRAAFDNDVDAADDEVEDRPGERVAKPTAFKWLALGSGIVAIAAIACLFWRENSHQDQLKALQAESRSLQVRAADSVRSYRLTPSANLPASPTLQLGWPDPPQLLDLRFDVSGSQFNTFQISIEKKDEARLLQIRRMARDSNKELRLSWNSSAFGPGEYQLRLEGYNWRGEVTHVGWVSIGIQ